MKLAISNIAWDKQYDEEMYRYLSDVGFTGIEIAPTRIFAENPYEHLEEARLFSKELEEKYRLNVCSMQSIWYGKKGNIFIKEDAEQFIEYTKRAIDFAHEIGCNNLVFGCPKNRQIPDGNSENDVIYFFKTIGEYAIQNNTVISIEPNPSIYGTNFINYTEEAFNFAKKVNCNGVKVNIDLGTIIQNQENISIIKDNINLINHIHISEPNLAIIEKRELHVALKNVLKDLGYCNYISIEMKNSNNIDNVKSTIEYVKGVFSMEER